MFGEGRWGSIFSAIMEGIEVAAGPQKGLEMKDRFLAGLLTVAAAALAACIISSDGPLEGCGGTMSPVEITNGWPRDQYLLILFGGSDRSAFDPARKAVAAAGRAVNIRLVDAPPAVSGARAAPAAALVSPRGRVLARFESAPRAKDLSPYWSSPKRTEIAKVLSESEAAVVVYAGPKAPHAAANMARAREEVKLARDLYEPTAKIMTLNPADPAERTLTRNLGIEASPDSEGFVIILARGRCLPPISGKTKENAILDRLNYLFTLCAACYPHQLEEDLLLELR